MLLLAPYFPNPHPHLPTASVVFLQNQNLLCQKEIQIHYLYYFAFLLMNSLGKQAVSTGSINQRVEIALFFSLCMFLRQTESVLLKISR